MRVRFVLVAVLIVASAMLLVGCGSNIPSGNPTSPRTRLPVSVASSTVSSNGIALKSPPEILAAAAAALGATHDYRYNGQEIFKGEINALDLQLSGSDKRLLLSIGTRTVEYLVLAGQTYAKLPDSLLQVPPGCLCTINDMRGKYVVTPLPSPFLVSILAAMPPAPFLNPVGTLSKGDVTSINGRSVVTVSDSKDGTVDWILSVATDGEPLPVRLTNPGRQGSYDFAYDAVTIAIPPASETFIPFFLKNN